jgi:uncharacterized protein
MNRTSSHPKADGVFSLEGWRWPRRGLFAIALIAILPLLIVDGLRRVERAVTFHPQRYSSGQYWQPPVNAEEVRFTTGDNVRLFGWFVESATGPAQATIIYFHGNSGNIGNLGWLGEKLAERGFNALVFDYRGYGRSEGEIRNERDLYADADAAYDYLVRERGASPDHIVLYGQSLGTAAAADLASRRKCAAVVLESGMTSARDMARVMLPWLPHWLERTGSNRLASLEKLPLIHCSVLVAHGDADRTIPISQGLELFAAANQPKRLIVVPGAGHDVCGSSGAGYVDQLAAFIREAVTPTT